VHYFRRFFMLTYFRKMSTKASPFTPKNADIFNCEKCTFKCSKQSDWNRHLMTRKHQNQQISTFSTNLSTLSTKKRLTEFTCDCGKVYKERTGLYKHKKKCNFTHSEINDISCNDSNSLDKELLVKMMMQNQDFIREIMSTMALQNKDVITKMIDLMPQVGNTNSHNSVINSHNKTFNIQMFLNEHCKNAMNLTDFIESLPITAETYDNTLENGLTKSMTHLITNGLSQLDVLERPIHCTDTARKTLYVKENNAWEKDNELLTLMEGVKKVIFKQRTMLKKWQNANEGWDTNELLQEKMTKLVFHSMADINNDEREMGKIIRAISKNVYLDNDTKSKYI